MCDIKISLLSSIYINDFISAIFLTKAIFQICLAVTFWKWVQIIMTVSAYFKILKTNLTFIMILNLNSAVLCLDW